MNTCSRCGHEDREPFVRLTLANLEREAYREGRKYAGPMFSHEWRCRDREACDVRRHLVLHPTPDPTCPDCSGRAA